ncbi:hypothetical protein F0L17_00410 [Streptomyces sp. TRM43335]|uniref:Uncharacterized protein n=1 Tax=Streptomyces taklimakanensis TaxID=2569853 RepID=A0A6G2B5U6_9ACTN|nr:hypothetical protein [Streptomyces taklimakanensis]MTE17620.1 hypothetical protein [Streptomyces taklimakanensis]
MAKARRRIDHGYRELPHGLGLDHFQGRTLAQRYHHGTAARAFPALMRFDPKARMPGP